MSLSALPEWKQLLLERKRREEEERERREREEEERLASMPAWKRGIIQRRRAKQDEERERGRERDGDVLEDDITEQTESKLTQIQQNPFLRSENNFRRDNRGKEVIRDGENEYKKTTNNKGRERNRETEMWVEKTGNKMTGKEIREMDSGKSTFPPFIGLRTIQANNIIIIENGEEKLDRRNKEVEEEDKRMRMDLREFLACGGSVTEIRASEVLIIKPPVMDGKRETEMPGERLEREGIWTSMRLTSRKVMQRAERVLNHKDRGTPERCGRVSQLLSKFGEHPKPPMRSKSSDCFNRPDKRYSSGDLLVQEDESEEEPDMSPTVRGVPKRSFSFSERVVSQQEKREEKTPDFRVMGRTYSDRVKTRVTKGDPSESQSRFARRWGRPKHDEPVHEKRPKERRVDSKKKDSICGEAEERASSGDVFTQVSVKNQEGVAFARRIPIKLDGRDGNSETEIKKVGKENERDSKTEREEKEFKTEAKTESERTWKQDEVGHISHGAYIPSSEDSTIDLSAEIRCQCVNTPSVDAGQRQEKVQSDRELKRDGHLSSHGDTDKISGEMSIQDQKEFPKQATEDIQCTSQLPLQSATLGQSKLYTQEGVIIPRTVFYGVDISAKRRASLPSGDGQAERRGSWKAGRPLTRVESLKERIRQQEKERRNSKEGDKQEGGGEAEATAREQEEATSQSVRPLDVTQDAQSPQLPVPASRSLLQSASTEREVGENASESDTCQGITERETERHVEESVWRSQDTDEGKDQTEREDELLEEEYRPPSLSPSPTPLDSLDAMSRIYNLKTVGSRTTMCVNDLPPHSGPQGKYNPIRQAPSPDVLPETAKLWNHGRDGEKSETTESTGVQTVQRHFERLQLKEQEAGCGSQNDRKALEEPAKRPDIIRETQKAPASPRFPQTQQKAALKPQQVRSFTINARTEDSMKPPELTSPSSSSPSSTPSPPLFSIRSASGGPGKRGTTITITPRRPASSNSVPTATTPKSAPPANKPTPAPSRETGKKRYPTAEEIQVIGGYQNLERSCLVKSRATPKAVKVCFDEAQLERVCEYPSEECVLVSLPCYPHPGPDDGGGRDEGGRGGGQEEEEDEESGASESTGRARFLKVDESCKRLSK